MEYIKDLFDPSKDINRKIEKVVTFGDHKAEQLEKELNEYVITEKLHDNYYKVMQNIREAFDCGSTEVGVWVSGFYGSGKSSFAKYLGYAFQKDVILSDGQTFAARLMNKIGDPQIKALDNVILSKNPIVIMIDLLVKRKAGVTGPISDIMYYETLKMLGNKVTEPKLIYLEDILKRKNIYDEFVRMIQEEFQEKWDDIVDNSAYALMCASSVAHKLLPTIFREDDALQNMTLDSVESEEDRLVKLMDRLKQKYHNDKVIFVLDEIGLYMGNDRNIITGLEGTMHTLKSKFQGNVWLIGTAQQTLTADSPDSVQEIRTLFDRFPIKVDIEADDIKEIVTKRLLGKSVEGSKHLSSLYEKYGPQMKLATELHDIGQRSAYYQQPDMETFVDLYPFLPVHIEILMNLLKKLAARSSGTSLRSVLRLIQDVLVDNRISEEQIGRLVTPADFFDILKNDMESFGFREVVQSAKNAINIYRNDPLAMRICQLIAVMQTLDDFTLSARNIVALLNDRMDGNVKAADVQRYLDEMKQSESITLQEVNGRYRFMTDVILNIQSERNRLQAKQQERIDVLREVTRDILMPPPSVQAYGTLNVQPAIELAENGKTCNVVEKPGSDIMLNIRYVEAAGFAEMRKRILSESNLPENNKRLYMICNISHDKDSLLGDIVKDRKIIQLHQNETNREILQYLTAQKSDEDAKLKELYRLLRQSFDNSEAIYLGQSQNVNSVTYKSEALKRFAESIYNKYPLASSNIKSSAVSEMAQYDDLSTLPPALKPFGIIDGSGGIKTDAPVIAEVKDYLQRSSSYSGTEVLGHFDKAPYKWQKDTTRYIIALMLRGGMLIVRSGGSEYKMLTKKAADALKNNQAFGRVDISVNSETTIDTAKLIKACKNIMSLFNPPKRPNPVFESVASTALECIRRKDGLLENANRLKDTFSKLHLAGEQTIDTAVNFAQQIVDTEGQAAPLLLSDNETCVAAFKYIKKISDTDREKPFLENVGTLRKLFEDSKPMESLRIPLLDTFKRDREEMLNAYSQKLQNPKCYDLYEDYANLLSKFRQKVADANNDFFNDAGRELETRKEDLRSSDGYKSLKEDQKSTVNKMLDGIMLPEGDSIEDLILKANTYSSFLIYYFNNIKAQIKSFEAQNEAEVHEPDPQTKKHPHKVTVNSHIGDKVQLNNIISDLERVRDNWDDYNGVDFDIQ